MRFISLSGLFLFLYSLQICNAQIDLYKIKIKDVNPENIKTGAEQTDVYYLWIKGKRIAVVANHTSYIKNVHLVDSLLNYGFAIKKVFCPEHGFRGKADAGEELGNDIDAKTKLPIISLYGANKKPKPEDLADVDVVIFDIQDVGARFYTYISTMHYMMEACAENNKLFIVLDRPNPNGFYVDGPVLDKEFTSFVGMHALPIVHGMTVAEYACMINGEKWLKDGIQCQLKYVTVLGYDHTNLYQLPIKPSPNLPTMASVYLYPSLCLFEGTCVSVGRGTETPFEVVGHPELDSNGFSFVPKSIPGMSKKPPFEGIRCFGYNFHEYADSIKDNGRLHLSNLIELYKKLVDKTEYFNSYFNKLAGNDKLKQQIIIGMSEEEIRNTWKPGIDEFKKTRKKYLLYKDFE